MRRDFKLSAEDENFLNQYGCEWETVTDGSPWVLLHGFHTHRGYNHEIASIAVRIESGYPDAKLDMVYVYPHLFRKDGKLIKATETLQSIAGKDWQRWSRHWTDKNPWKPGEDSIETHIYCIEEWFQREFENEPELA